MNLQTIPIRESAAPQTGRAKVQASDDVSSRKKSIHVRLATKSDKEDISRLARQTHEAGQFGEFPFSEKKFLKVFDAKLADAGRSVPLIAEHNGKVVGFLSATIGEYFVSESGKIVSVQVIAVENAIKRSLLGGKVAMKLKGAITKWAKEHEASFLLFHVTSGADIKNVDKYFRKSGAITLGGNYAVPIE